MMEEKFRKLFQPTMIGSMHLQNRFAMAAMTTNGDPLAEIDDKMIEYYEERARGGIGLIMFETQYVSNKIDPWTEVVTAVGTPTQRRQFVTVTDRLKGYGAKLCLQLSIGTGRNSFPVPGKRLISASEVPTMFDPTQKTRALTIEEVHEISAAFGRIALMAKEAGFDSVEVHSHTGYLLDQFLSACWNHRTDEYGGNFENRMRLHKEIVEEIHMVAGPDFPVIVRLSGQHRFPEGRQLDEFPAIIEALDNAGYDAFDIDEGSYDAMEWIFPPSYLGDAAYIESAKAARSATKKPIMCAGNITPDIAADLVNAGVIDYPMIGRGLIADPYYVNKIHDGKIEDICPCIRCNEFCFGRAFALSYMTCAVNTQACNEKALAIHKTQAPKKVVIVGGGVAGLEAAKVAALKGHTVTLYEKSDELGGQVNAASTPPFKKQLKQFLDYQINQVKKLGVEIVFNKAITADSPELLEADEIIVAIGASTIKPRIPGIDNANVIDVIDAHTTRHKEIGQNVIMAGGGLSGCDCALELAMEGKKVTIVEMLSDIAPKANIPNKMALIKKIAEYNIQVLTGHKLLAFNDQGAKIEDASGKQIDLEADSSIIAFGTKSNSKLADSIFLNHEHVKIIGDCAKIGLVGNAVRDGFLAANTIA